MRWIVCLLAIAATPVAANKAFEGYDPAILQTCLDQTGPRADKSACIGVGADDCIAGDAGSSNVGYGMCMAAEWQDWDERLNDVYVVLGVQQTDLHESLQAYNTAFSNPVEVMRDMQRAWIAYRDLACDWERLQWSGGTGAGPAAAECMLRLTAQQALFLHARAH